MTPLCEAVSATCIALATGTLAPLASWVSRSISWLHLPAVTMRTGVLNTSWLAVVEESTSVCSAEVSAGAAAVST